MSNTREIWFVSCKSFFCTVIIVLLILPTKLEQNPATAITADKSKAPIKFDAETRHSFCQPPDIDFDVQVDADELTAILNLRNGTVLGKATTDLAKCQAKNDTDKGRCLCRLRVPNTLLLFGSFLIILVEIGRFVGWACSKKKSCASSGVELVPTDRYYRLALVWTESFVWFLVPLIALIYYVDENDYAVSLPNAMYQQNYFLKPANWTAAVVVATAGVVPCFVHWVIYLRVVMEKSSAPSSNDHFEDALPVVEEEPNSWSVESASEDAKERMKKPKSKRRNRFNNTYP